MTASSSSSSSSPVVAAVAQLRSTSDKLFNLAAVAECAGAAAASGARILFLPEVFGLFTGNVGEKVDRAEPPLPAVLPDPFRDDDDDDGLGAVLASAVAEARRRHRDETQREAPFAPYDSVPALRALRDAAPDRDRRLLPGLRAIARASGLWIAGTLHERTNDDEDRRVHNAHVVVDADGGLVGYYRKVHLFDVDLPDGSSLRESATTAPGDVLSVVVENTPVGPLGLTVCYDLRFPEVFVDAVGKGARVIAVPSAFTVPTGRVHWRALLRARAIESQCHVVAAAQYGAHDEEGTRTSYGHALAVGPWGDVLADAGGFDSRADDGDVVVEPPGIVTFRVDADETDRVRARMPVRAHRRRREEAFRRQSEGNTSR